MFDVNEQRLLDQKKQIVTKKWLSDLELNEFKENSMCVTEQPDKNGCEGSFGFDEEDVVVCEHEDTYLNQDRHSDNDECEVVTRLILKHGTV